MFGKPGLLSSLVYLVFLLAACSRSGEPIGVGDVEGPLTWGAAANVTHVRHLYFSAQPDEATLEAARDANVRVIIDLRAESEREWDEEQSATGLGMRYYRVPVPEKEPFSAEAFARIDELVEQHDDQQIPIHCSTGNRAAGWFASHLVKKHAMEFDDAIIVARKAGITKEEIVEKVARLLGEPVPAAAAAPTEMPAAEALREQARSLFGTLPAEASSDANPVTDAKVELGRMLYYDERFSRNHDISCNTCHPLDRFGADGDRTSAGHRGARGERNSPTVYNAAFHLAQFWDGRAADVEEQARGPIQNPVEMAMPSGEAAEKVVRSIPGYAPLFRAAFPGEEDPVTFDNTVRAIGAFERRLVTPARFDDFLAGDAVALTPGEQRGLAVFIQAGCTACHSGPILGGRMYQKLGLVHPYEIEDTGRHAVTKNETDRYFFKVPSLRNVVETGPYFHDGGVAALEEVVRLMAWHQVGRELPNEEIAAIVTFLGSLTGRIDASLIARPTLPASGPDTPAPDPSEVSILSAGFAPPVPRPEDSGPVTEREAASLVEQRCSGCHRLVGEAASKFRIAAPDLIWGGDKYQRDWLVGWLQGREPNMYPGAYRWDQAGDPPLHPTVVAEEALAIAAYFERHLRDPRVRDGVFDLAILTELEIRRGGELFREYSCIGCHQVLENGKPAGGPISTTFFDAARRYDPDWVFAFNMDPPGFAPHSGEYVADVSERKARWITGYIMAQGVDAPVFAQPWKGAAFASADPKRGETLYREYCAQCHGLSGEGDGPGAMGLDPKPAAHARMAIHEMPEDYLYNVVFFGGKEVGKSESMPDWGMTLGTQQLADVIGYMRATFRAEVAPSATGAGNCPQPRTTQQAPAEQMALSNPVEPTAENLEAGRKLYHETAVPMACHFCHGAKGDGLGPMAGGFTPPPRNFTCADTMEALPDGQLYWIIRNGSAGTGMMGFATISEDQIWQLVHYIRSFAR